MGEEPDTQVLKYISQNLMGFDKMILLLESKFYVAGRMNNIIMFDYHIFIQKLYSTTFL